MPYSIRKVRNKKCYQVKNKITGKIHAKCSFSSATTRDLAEKQVRLLYMQDNQK